LKVVVEVVLSNAELDEESPSAFESRERLLRPPLEPRDRTAREFTACRHESSRAWS